MFSWRWRRWLVVGFVFLSSGGLKAEPPGPNPERVDSFGDPLPPGALVRLGTLRLRGTGGIAAALSPDGKTLAIVDERSAVRLVEPLTGKEVRLLSAGVSGPYTALAFSSDGKKLAATGRRDRIYLWDVATGRELCRIDIGVEVSLPMITFSADGNFLALAGTRPIGSSRLDPPERALAWEASTGKALGSFEVAGTGRVWVALSPDGKTLLACGHASYRRATQGNPQQDVGRTIQRWNLATGAELPRIKTAIGDVVDAAFSRDGKVLAVSGTGGNIQLLDPATGNELRRLTAPEGVGAFLAFSPDGKILVAGGEEGLIEGWDLATGEALALTRGPKGSRVAVSFPGNGRLLAWGVDGNSVRLWDARTGRVLSPEVGHHREVQFLAFTPDGHRLISGSPDGQVCVWEVATGKALSRITTPRDSILPRSASPYAIAASGYIVSPDGKYLAVRPRDGPLLLWQTATGQYVLRLGGSRFQVPASPETFPIGTSAPVFSPNSRMVASGMARYNKAGVEGKVIVWELASGVVRADFAGHLGTTTVLAFSPDGRRLATGGADTTTLVWDLTGHVPGPPAIPAKLTVKQLDDLWDALKTPDGRKAFQAMQTLTAAPRDAVPYLARVLLPDSSKTVDVAAMARLIADLDNDDFAIREKASQELEGLGQSAVGALRQALAQGPSPEATRRLKQLLDKLGEDVQTEALRRPDAETPQRRKLRERMGDPGEPDVPPPAWGVVRLQRAVEVLETIATPEAKETLAKLAKGHPADPLTQEAKEAVRRLAQRGVTP